MAPISSSHSHEAGLGFSSLRLRVFVGGCSGISYFCFCGIPFGSFLSVDGEIFLLLQIFPSQVIFIYLRFSISLDLAICIYNRQGKFLKRFAGELYNQIAARHVMEENTRRQRKPLTSLQKQRKRDYDHQRYMNKKSLQRHDIPKCTTMQNVFSGNVAMFDSTIDETISNSNNKICTHSQLEEGSTSYASPDSTKKRCKPSLYKRKASHLPSTIDEPTAGQTTNIYAPIYITFVVVVNGDYIDGTSSTSSLSLPEPLLLNGYRSIRQFLRARRMLGSIVCLPVPIYKEVPRV